MKKLVLLILLAPTLSMAQTDRCDCPAIFEEAIDKLEANYIALAQMQGTERETTYQERVAAFRQKVEDVHCLDCTAFLQEFLEFFDDGHLFVIERPSYTEEDLMAFREKMLGNRKSPADLQKELTRQTAQPDPHPAIGHWTDGKQEYILLPEGDYLNAYILIPAADSIPDGTLKASFKAKGIELSGTYYAQDYSPRHLTGNIYKKGTVLNLLGGIYWRRLDGPPSREKNTAHPGDPKLPTITKLDDQNTLFVIPSFSADYQGFIQIVLDNLDLLRNTTNLIFDIRGNTGGNAIYMAFLDAYATRPKPASQGLVLASEATGRYFRQFAERSPEVYGPVAERIEAHMGEIVDGPLYPERVFDPFESRIENVAILAGPACMSAAESFILHSQRASSKVTAFGQPTGGVIDYTSVHMLKLKSSGDQNLLFGYPTSTLHKEIPENGYNQTGIIPDVPIDDSVSDPVQFIIDYYQ
jgi:hypothetical protein